MTNAALASSLNDELDLSGSDAVTVNVIRQWVAWGVLPRATAKASVIGINPQWHRHAPAYRTALKLAKARRAGMRRETAVISQAWIEWGYDNTERARAAILAEYISARERLTKRVSTNLDFRDYSELSATRKRAIRTQSGPLDDRFRGSAFELTPEFYATALQSARDGSHDALRLTGLIRDAIDQVVPSLSGMVDLQQIEAAAASFSGMLGYPSEIEDSVQDNLQTATHHQLRTARTLARRALRAMRKAESISDLPTVPPDAARLAAELAMLPDQINYAEWPVFMFCQSLQSVCSRRDQIDDI